MKKSIVCSAVLLAALMGMGTYYSVGRIAACDGHPQATSACVAQAWDSEKVNLLPKYDPNRYVSDPTTDSIYAASQIKR